MIEEKKRGGACPICGKPVDPNLRSFCSKRCADIDLGRWLGERYVVPGPIAPEDGADRPSDGNPGED
ncbi:MAG TPA: DNA gyrase inhibitor YacG [Alphaproteobacteria bacterium]|nr:DNA gyrase inhibitor YacG [Alphaproteobacteria bacterium]